MSLTFVDEPAGMALDVMRTWQRWLKKAPRGARLTELLKQPQYQPMSVMDQILSIYAGTRGFLDEVPVNDVARWEKAFLTFMHDRYQNIIDEFAAADDLTDAIVEKLNGVIEEFQKGFKKPTDAS